MRVVKYPIAMKKATLFKSTVLALLVCVGFAACENNSSEVPEEPETYTVQLGWAGEILDISYEPNKYSWATIQAKKIAYMTELAEYCRYRVSNPRNEAFNIYTNGADPIVRLNMTTALVIAQRYLEDMENGIKLSKSRTDYIIQDVINNGSMYDYDCVVAKYT